MANDPTEAQARVRDRRFVHIKQRSSSWQESNETIAQLGKIKAARCRTVEALKK